ncbi:MAG: site-specific integrase [Xanthomonadaceae bacterium]|nr:site-specific integrase [Xanthomonadaceae bacterium]
MIARWEEAVRDKTKYSYEPNTITDHVSSLSRWTKAWLERPASMLTIGDAREVFSLMENAGRSLGYRKQVKHTINLVYRWGIEQRLIPGVREAPVQGLALSNRKVEKVPEILNLDEIRCLLRSAKQLEHPWYSIWVMALLTGMRNGELHALLWSDVNLQDRKITVSKSYHSRRRVVKSTKSGCWRTVPISDELLVLLLELKASAEKREHVLPRFHEWDAGRQANMLRKFCIGIGVRSVRFHTLRACFATQLLANDVASARVMKICGWADLKTMQKYIRLAGVDEKGATQTLRVLPSDMAAMKEVVDLFEAKQILPSV